MRTQSPTTGRSYHSRETNMAATYTRADIEKRNTKEDAVFVIDNVVYNVTEFLDDHPGGVEVLLDNAGKDASECFHDIGHSDDAKDWMKKFVIGEVVEEDRREVRRRDHGIGGKTELTWRSLLAVWLPPLALAAGAVVLYSYLFG